MCMSGGGSSGASSAELIAQEAAATAKAQAETERINAEKDSAKEAANSQTIADQAAVANADAARRVKNRTLLAGLGLEEADGTASPTDNSLEDPTSKSTAKSKKAKTLIAGVS